MKENINEKCLREMKEREAVEASDAATQKAIHDIATRHFKTMSYEDVKKMWGSIGGSSGTA